MCERLVRPQRRAEINGQPGVKGPALPYRLISTMQACILLSRPTSPKRATKACVDTSTAVATRVGSRASISFLRGIPRQKAMAGMFRESARLRFAMVVS